MPRSFDEMPAVRVRTTIGKETNIYVSVGADQCFAKFAYENRPENQQVRDIITAVCDAVSLGLRRLNKIEEQQ